MTHRYPFITAELSANHLGDINRALAIVEAASKAGADAIKLQTWSPDTMCVDRSYTLDSGPWAGRKLFDLYREAWTPWDWHPVIFDYARSLGLIPFSAAFDVVSVDFLDALHVDRHKVASFELVDLPLIRRMARSAKPIILSTGMARAVEIDEAVKIAKMGTPDITLLKCTSAYPASAADANLSTVLAPLWAGRWGLSDHSVGFGVACAATAMGARYIEKHLTLARSDGGPDAGFSLEPDEFKLMVEAVRSAAAAIGTPSYGPRHSESTSLRRSLWVCRDISQGEELILGVNVCTARPALGLPPGYDIHGMVASMAVKAGTPLTEPMIR